MLVPGWPAGLELLPVGPSEETEQHADGVGQPQSRVWVFQTKPV